MWRSSCWAASCWPHRPRRSRRRLLLLRRRYRHRHHHRHSHGRRRRRCPPRPPLRPRRIHIRPEVAPVAHIRTARQRGVAVLSSVVWRWRPQLQRLPLPNRSTWPTPRVELEHSLAAVVFAFAAAAAAAVVACQACWFDNLPLRLCVICFCCSLYIFRNFGGGYRPASRRRRWLSLPSTPVSFFVVVVVLLFLSH